jgi:hypothetical protein
MAARKTPVLLREAPLSKRINALTNYRRMKAPNDADIIVAATNGKHDVTADFDAIICQMLLDDAPDALPILDEVSSDEMYALTEEKREQLRIFYEAVRAIVERHNSGPHVKP